MRHYRIVHGHGHWRPFEAPSETSFGLKSPSSPRESSGDRSSPVEDTDIELRFGRRRRSGVFEDAEACELARCRGEVGADGERRRTWRTLFAPASLVALARLPPPPAAVAEEAAPAPATERLNGRAPTLRRRAGEAAVAPPVVERRGRAAAPSEPGRIGRVRIEPARFGLR